MGNSFFRPYAEKLDDMVSYTEIENHDATTVFRGGENGNPYNFWNATLKYACSSYRKWVHYYEARSVGVEVSRLTLKRNVHVNAE